MKPQWQNLSKQIGLVTEHLTEFIARASDRKMAQAAKIIQKDWNTLIVLHNEFDKLVEPIPQIEVKLPFNSTEFAQAWKFYKEYLEESHGAYIASRREAMMLKRLAKLADKKEDRAIEMLEFFICHGHKSIFKPSEKQLTGEEPAKVEETESKSNFDLNTQKLDI